MVINNLLDIIENILLKDLILITLKIDRFNTIIDNNLSSTLNLNNTLDNLL